MAQAQTKVYKRINTLRKNAGLTWSELATIAGIPLASWMTGVPTSSPTDEEIRKIAEIFGVTYDYIKYGK